MVTFQRMLPKRERSRLYDARLLESQHEIRPLANFDSATFHLHLIRARFAARCFRVVPVPCPCLALLTDT